MMGELQLLRQHHDAEWFVLSVRELREHERVQLGLVVWGCARARPPKAGSKANMLLFRYQSYDILPAKGRLRFTFASRQAIVDVEVSVRAGACVLIQTIMGKFDLVAADLFSGAGGLSFGFQQAGFHVAFANDINPDYAYTYQQ